MVLLEPDAFLTQLTKILDKSKGTGTIYVTMKRCVCPRSQRPPACRVLHHAHPPF